MAKFTTEDTIQFGKTESGGGGGGGDTIWGENSNDVFTLNNKNINLQDKGLKDSFTTTPINLADIDNHHLITESQTIIGSTNEIKKALDLKLDKETLIQGGTATKITYNQNGLVTGGSNATTNDISDSLNKRYVTDDDLTKLSNTSGINTGDESNSSIKLKLGFSSSTTDGYLTKEDWNTFNNKGSGGSSTLTNTQIGVGDINNTLSGSDKLTFESGFDETDKYLNIKAESVGTGLEEVNRNLSLFVNNTEDKAQINTDAGKLIISINHIEVISIDKDGNVNILNTLNNQVLTTNALKGFIESEEKGTAFNTNYGTDVNDIKMNGVATIGTKDVARIDHIHPSDTSKANDANVLHLTGNEISTGTKTFEKINTTNINTLSTINLTKEGSNFKDQYLETGSTGAFRTDVWQSFTPSQNGYLTKVSIFGAKNYYNSSNYTSILYIYEGEGTSGNQLYSSNYNYTTTYGWFDLLLNSSVYLVAGQKYTFRTISSANDLFNWGGSYSGGTSSLASGIQFRTYLTPITNSILINELSKIILNNTSKNQVVTTNNSDNTIQSEVKLTAFNKDFESNISNIKMNGIANIGSSGNVSDASHIHPSDTTREAITNKSLIIDNDTIKYPCNKAVNDAINNIVIPTGIVHLAGDETITGLKTIDNNLIINKSLETGSIDITNFNKFEIVKGSDAEIKDQYLETGSNTSQLTTIWQSFTPSLTGSLTKIFVYLNNVSNITNFYVYKGEGIGGELLLSETPLLIGTGVNWYQLGLSKNIHIDAGQKYTFKIVSSNNVIYYYGGTYTGGTSSIIGNSIQFRTYVIGHADIINSDANGNIGINNPTPTEKLDVIGNIKASGYLKILTGLKDNYITNPLPIGSATDLSLNTTKTNIIGAINELKSSVDLKAQDSNTMHLTGIETATGKKNFIDGIVIQNIDNTGTTNTYTISNSEGANFKDQYLESAPSMAQRTDFWQSFTPSQNGNLTKIELYLTPTGENNVPLYIYEGEGITGKQIYSELINITQSGSNWYTLGVTNKDIYLKSGSKYTFRIVKTTLTTVWYGGTYTGGLCSIGGSTMFRTYLTPKNINFYINEDNNILLETKSPSSITDKITIFDKNIRFRTSNINDNFIPGIVWPDGTKSRTKNEVSFYETTTIASTAEKVVTANINYLTTGMRILVKFVNGNTSDTPTLNINGLGAKNIIDESSNIVSASNKFIPKTGTVVEFVYDGTSFVYINRLSRSLIVGTYGNITTTEAQTTNYILDIYSNGKTRHTGRVTDITNLEKSVYFYTPFTTTSYYISKSPLSTLADADNVQVKFITIANLTTTKFDVLCTNKFANGFNWKAEGF